MYQEYTKEEQQSLNYNSNLIKDFVVTGMEMMTSQLNKRKTEKSELASFFLFRQTLEMGDAISILIKEGCVNSCKPLLRTLLETYFQFAYLLSEDEARKSLQFFYHYEKSKRQYYEKLVDDSKDSSFFQKQKNDKHLKGFRISKEQKAIYQDNIKKIDLVLNSLDNADIAAEYSAIEYAKRDKKSGKIGKVKYWYELFNGVSSIVDIAIKLQEVALYELIYRECSSYSHGEDIVHSNLVSIDENNSGITFLRDIRQLDVIANFTILLIRESCTLFLSNKVDDKVSFAEKLLPYILRSREAQQNMS